MIKNKENTTNKWKTPYTKIAKKKETIFPSNCKFPLIGKPKKGYIKVETRLFFQFYHTEKREKT